MSYPHAADMSLMTNNLFEKPAKRIHWTSFGVLEAGMSVC